MKKLLTKFNCFVGNHDITSEGEEKDYDFSTLKLEGKSHDEIVEIFFQQCELKCKHCNYRYKGLSK